MMLIKMDIKPRQLEIIEVAGKLLTNSGINGLTIKNLANEMNFSEGAIYRHFKNKEEIMPLLRYLHENVQESSERYLKAVISRKISPPSLTDWHAILKRILLRGRGILRRVNG